MSTPLSPLITELLDVHAAMTHIDAECSSFLTAIRSDQQASARNLLQYLALRRHDLRKVQPLLASSGLSSLGRTESHVRYGLETVLKVLHALEGGVAWEPAFDTQPLTKDQGEILLAGHTDALFGPPPDRRTVRIMVTMPGEAAADYLLVRALVDAGMDCMRINCAHDDRQAWERMTEHVRRANRDLQRACRISMDIAGPKLRTGALEPGPQVLKVKPRRDVLGQVIRPALVALTRSARHGPCGIDARLTLDAEPPAGLRSGGCVEFDDARGRPRSMRMRECGSGAVIAELDRTAYFVSGTLLRFDTTAGPALRHVVDVPSIPETLLLNRGDTLQLTPDSSPGRAAVHDDHQRVLVPARIGITLPEVFRDVRPGETIWFDDGKIGGVIREVEADQIAIDITHAKPDGGRLGPGKGINLPDTNLRLSALTAKDVDDLSFIARHADMVAYSFVRHADDIVQLQQRLAALQADRLGVILKIETRQAFEELPKLLLACMRGGPFGVMIARGDLAVECGFERMAEVQEEILWICEAAHAPVIWATQVLESLAKTGMASRAEVTDAAMSERAECVMLNKGPFIREAVCTLDNILRRMQAHQSKKRAMLRPLRLAHSALSDLFQPSA
jgi:pyruvate kinase